MGIAPLIVAAVQGFISALVAVGAVLLTPLKVQEVGQVVYVLVGVGLFGGIVIHLIGLGLRIARALCKRRKRLLAVVGMFFNASAIAVLLLLLLTGSLYRT